MFHQPSPSMGSIPNRKRIHQHHESKEWTRLPASQKCLECFPIRKPFLETAFGKVPPEIREVIFKDVLTVGSISPLKDGISVPITKAKQDYPDRHSETKLSPGPARPASCLALLQTCRQIYHETSLLFYSLNTLYLSSPQEMIWFFRHLGPLRCDEIHSLHLEDVLVSAPTFSKKYIDQLRAQRLHPEYVLATLAEERDVIHPDVKRALRLLNKRRNIQQIYLDMRPSQTLEYIKLCTLIPGLKNCEISFESPTRWSVMPPSKKWETRSWFLAFLNTTLEDGSRDISYHAYWRGNEKYRVQVDILGSSGRIAGRDVKDGTADGSSMDTAMEDLSLY